MISRTVTGNRSVRRHITISPVSPSLTIHSMECNSVRQIRKTKICTTNIPVKIELLSIDKRTIHDVIEMMYLKNEIFIFFI